MNKTFEQVSNAKHHFFIDEILLAGLINWIESNSVTLSQALCHFVSFRVDQIPPDPGFVYAFCISLRLLLYPSSTFSEFFYHYINFVNLLQFLEFRLQENKPKRK